MAKIRKRIIVTECDFKLLHYEVEQIRNTEKRELYQAKFKNLMIQAQLVNLSIQKKEVANG